MKRIRMMTLLSIKDSLRTKACIPFFIMSVLAWFPMLLGFGVRFRPNAYANNIISNYFQFLSFGILFTGLVLGATSMFLERRANLMFTLPISRTEIAVGKLLGTQIIVGAGLIVGYLISIAFAVHFGLSSFAYSRLSLVTAFSVSFAYLCISIPLGFWLSPIWSALITYLVIQAPSMLNSFVSQQWITNSWTVWVNSLLQRVAPGQVDTAPLSRAFYDKYVFVGDYAGPGKDVLLSFVVFMLLVTLARHKELSLKS